MDGIRGEEEKERRRTVMGRTKLIAVLEEQHACQWCLENLISPATAPVPYPVPVVVPPAVISRYHREKETVRCKIKGVNQRQHLADT